jgi:hypothetical protein
VPWWAAILIAAAATLAGVAIDASSGVRELTNVFAALYLIGCVAAVLAVRRTGIFTAVVQPPLILFVAIPAAYYLFHRAEIEGAKDVLINCGYPLIERFLLMLTTSVLVLLIGLARWYLAADARSGAAGAIATGVAARIGAKVSALLGRPSGEDDDARGRAARGTRTRRTAGATGERRPGKRAAAASRSRHVRPPMDDPAGPTPTSRRRYADHVGDGDRADLSPPPRRRRSPRDPGRRTTPRQRDWEPTDPHPRRRVSRYDHPYDPYDAYVAYEPESFDPPAPQGTHHPFSNARYRGGETEDGRRKYRRPRQT